MEPWNPFPKVFSKKLPKKLKKINKLPKFPLILHQGDFQRSCQKHFQVKLAKEFP